MISRCGLSGRAAHSESTREGSIGSGTRDTWRARATSGGTLPAWVLGTRVALGGFQGKYQSLDPRCTRGLPGGSFVYGYSGHVALSEAKSETGLRRTFGVTFWTRGILRKFLKEVPTEASMGHSAGLRDGSERGFWEHVSYSERLRKGSFGVARPEGVFERISEGVFERFPRGSSGLTSEGLPEGFPRGFLKEVAKGSSGRLPRRAAMVVGSKMGGGDGSVRSDWPECSGRCGPLDLRSTARVGRLVRTGRTDRPFLAIRSEINGGDASGGFLFQGKGRLGGARRRTTAGLTGGATQ